MGYIRPEYGAHNGARRQPHHRYIHRYPRTVIASLGTVLVTEPADIGVSIFRTSAECHNTVTKIFPI